MKGAKRATRRTTSKMMEDAIKVLSRRRRPQAICVSERPLISSGAAVASSIVTHHLPSVAHSPRAVQVGILCPAPLPLTRTVRRPRCGASRLPSNGPNVT